MPPLIIAHRVSVDPLFAQRPLLQPPPHRQPFPRRALDVQDVIRDWLGKLNWSAKVRVTVDVDPYSFL